MTITSEFKKKIVTICNKILNTLTKLFRRGGFCRGGISSEASYWIKNSPIEKGVKLWGCGHKERKEESSLRPCNHLKIVRRDP